RVTSIGSPALTNCQLEMPLKKTTGYLFPSLTLLYAHPVRSCVLAAIHCTPWPTPLKLEYLGFTPVIHVLPSSPSNPFSARISPICRARFRAYQSVSP